MTPKDFINVRSKKLAFEPVYHMVEAGGVPYLVEFGHHNEGRISRDSNEVGGGGLRKNNLFFTMRPSLFTTHSLVMVRMSLTFFSFPWLNPFPVRIE